VKQLHSSNIKIMVSVGGGNNVKPTTDGWVAQDTANDVAQFVKNNYLDGADLDWEVCFLRHISKPRMILMHSFLCRMTQR
jgi:GH18 family chitinase